MDSVTLLDKTFEKYLSSAEIQERIAQIASEIQSDYAGKKPLFIAILNGAFRFTDDLIRNIDQACEITFVKVASYSGTTSTGKVNQLIGLDEDLTGKDVIVLEDIVDTGLTMHNIEGLIRQQQPASFKIATLLFKPDAYTKDIPIDYIAFEVPNHFLVGYGLDYDGLGRNLNDIYKLAEK